MCVLLFGKNIHRLRKLRRMHRRLRNLLTIESRVIHRGGSTLRRLSLLRNLGQLRNGGRHGREPFYLDRNVASTLKTTSPKYLKHINSGYLKIKRLYSHVSRR